MHAVDIIQIHQLLGLYGHYLDDAQWDRFGELFTPDATIDYTAVGASDVFRGLDEIVGFFRTANHPSAHHVTNIVVIDGGDDVHVHSKFLVPYTRQTHQPKRWYGGDYDDIVVDTPAGWRFAVRRCTARWQYTSDDSSDVPQHRRTW